MHGIAPVSADPAAVPMDATDTNEPKHRRTPAPAAASPGVAEIAGPLGSTGPGSAKAAELLELRDREAGTPCARVMGPTSPKIAADAPESAGDDAKGEPDALAADPFAPLIDAGRAGHAAPTDGGDDPDDVLTLLPCPGAVPGLDYFRLKDGPAPSGAWVYRDAAGAPLVVAARYDGTNTDGAPTKDVRHWTFGRRVWTDRTGKKRDRTGWHFKAPPSPRPLYGLDRITARPEAAVLVTEVEKTADAASTVFPDLVCTTSQGGSKVPGKSDWTPLRDRRVTIWPDHDGSGASYAAKVSELVTVAGAASVRIVEIPADWPAGWDLADPLPNGVSLARLRQMVDDAPDGAAAELPAGFRMSRRGLFFYPEATEKNPDPAPVFIAAPFRVVGETRSDAGENWGLLLHWRDREGRPHQWAIPRRLIHQPGNEIAEELEHAGLSCGPDARAHDLLKRFIGGVRIARLLRCVTRTGWHQADGGPVFVLPGGEAFGRGAADVILQADHASADAAYRAAGSLEGWQGEVAALAVGNDRLVLFLAAAFAGPLLDVLGEPSGGVHLVGHSRTGKSTAAVVAASVWGKPSADAQLRQWRGTANGLEAAAVDTSDTLLILDEMGQADAREVADVVYMLANEAGKQRASRIGTAGRRQSWRSMFVSTGETTLAQKMGEVGRRATAGLDVRLVNLTADAGAGLGVFQNLHERPSAAVLAEELRDAARAHHGTAARAFLTRLARDRAANPAELRAAIDDLRAAFLKNHVPDSVDGQVRSVASRFALMGAAGELARDYGVLPWPEGEAMRAAGACFAAWLVERGGTGSGENAAALAQVRAFLEAHGESRFTLLGPSELNEESAAADRTRTVNRAGFRRRVGGGEGERWEYLVLPETWKTEVCKGLDPRRVADLLAARGWLTGATERRRAARVTVPGEGKRRVYMVSGAILGDDTEEGGFDGAR